MRHDPTGSDISACLSDGARFARLVHIIEDRTGLFHENHYRTRFMPGQVIGRADSCCVTFAMSLPWKR